MLCYPLLISNAFALQKRRMIFRASLPNASCHHLVVRELRHVLARQAAASIPLHRICVFDCICFGCLYICLVICAPKALLPLFTALIPSTEPMPHHFALPT
jgi:hypothetical protein